MIELELRVDLHPLAHFLTSIPCSFLTGHPGFSTLGSGAKPGANPGKGWPGWEGSIRAVMAAAWQTHLLPLPLQLPAFTVLLKQQPGSKWASLPLSWAHPYGAGCRWLAFGPCTPPPPQARNSWPVPVVSA